MAIQGLLNEVDLEKKNAYALMIAEVMKGIQDIFVKSSIKA